MAENVHTGLSSSEAEARLKEFGFNELSDEKKKTLLMLILSIMKEPMFLILLICASLYTLLGDYKEGAVLLSSTLLIIFISVYQHQKTEKALEMLMNLSSPRVIVRRDGCEQRIPGRFLVPGGIILLHEGIHS